MSAGKLFRKKGTGNFGMRDMLFTEDEYREALKRFLEICDAPADTDEANELEHLMIIMEIYERDNCS